MTELSSVKGAGVKAPWLKPLGVLEETTGEAPFCPVGMEPKERVIGVVVMGVLLLLALTFLYKKWVGEGVWDTNPCDDPEIIKERQLSRGTVASVVSALAFGLFNSLLDGGGRVHPATSTALVGLLLGGTVGYVADNSIGTEVSYRLYQKSWRDGVNYGFGVLATGSYARFLVTVLLDTFISICIFAIAYPLVVRLPFFRCNTALANGITSSLIAMVTFQAYTNQTRFLWAYPDKNTPEDRQIDPTVMYLAAVIAGIVWMQADTCSDFLKQTDGKWLAEQCSGLDRKEVKMAVVLFLLIFLTGISMSKVDRSPPVYRHAMKYYPKGRKFDLPEHAVANYVTKSDGTTIVRSVFANKDVSPKSVMDNAVLGKTLFMVLFVVCVLGTTLTSKLDNTKILWGVVITVCVVTGIILFSITPEYDIGSFSDKDPDGRLGTTCVARDAIDKGEEGEYADVGALEEPPKPRP